MLFSAITKKNDCEYTPEEVSEVTKHVESYSPQIISLGGVAYINYELNKMLFRTATPDNTSTV